MKTYISLLAGLVVGIAQPRAAVAPGPDAYGYVAEASTSSSFTNIAGAATRVLYFNDDGATNANLGFTFRFYGVDYTNVWFNVNGLITFGALSYAYSNVDLAISSPEDNLPLIAVLWDDWETRQVGSDGIYFRTQGAPGARQFIVQWNRVIPVQGVGLDPVTFQARLFEGSNQILLSHLDTQVSDDPPYSSGAYATVGIRDVDGHLSNRNLQWSHNQPVITNGLNILFTPTNHPPQAVDDMAATPEDTPLLVNVLANDTDVDGNALTITSLSAPTNGTATISNGVAVIYSPFPNFNGSDFLIYTISDGQGATATAGVSIIVTPVDDPPVGQGDSYSCPEDTSVLVAAPGVLSNDMDFEGEALTALLIAGPTNGTLVLSQDGSFQYWPATNFCGTDRFTYAVSAGNATSAPVVVSLLVTPENDPPAAGADFVATFVNASIQIPVTLLLANDTDPDPSDHLTITNVDATGTAGGTASLLPGSVIFSPAAEYQGTDSFHYILSDSWGSSCTGLVTLTVWPPPQLNLPVASTNGFCLGFSSIPGRLYRVEACTNLINWLSIGNATEVAPGQFEFVDNQSQLFTNRFYRILKLR